MITSGLRLEPSNPRWPRLAIGGDPVAKRSCPSVKFSVRALANGPFLLPDAVYELSHYILHSGLWLYRVPMVTVIIQNHTDSVRLRTQASLQTLIARAVICTRLELLLERRGLQVSLASYSRTISTKCLTVCGIGASCFLGGDQDV